MASTIPDPLATQLTIALHRQLLISYGETECHCVQASQALAWLLDHSGQPSCFVAGTWRDRHGDAAHCWVTNGDWIYDPTADQFDGQARLIVSANSSHYIDQAHTDWSQAFLAETTPCWDRIAASSWRGHGLSGRWPTNGAVSWLAFISQLADRVIGVQAEHVIDLPPFVSPALQAAA